MPITTNAITAGWTGTFGKKIVFRQRNGKTITSAYPDMSERVLSPAQLRINKLMKEANMHVKEIMGNEEERNKAQLRLNVTRNKLYTSLIREYFQIHLKPANSTTA